jgi:hypothetical protein
MQDHDKIAKGIIYISGTISRHVNKKLYLLVSDSLTSSTTLAICTPVRTAPAGL